MSMSDRDGFIWHDGKLVPCAKPPRTFLPILAYGMGVLKVCGDTKRRKARRFPFTEHTDGRLIRLTL